MYDDFVAFVLADPTVAGLIASRMHPGPLPQGEEMPAVTYGEASNVRLRSLSGPSGKARPRIEVNSWDKTYGGVKALAAAIRIRLDGFKGDMGATRVDGLFIDGERDTYERDTRYHRVIQEFVLSHVE